MPVQGWDPNTLVDPLLQQFPDLDNDRQKIEDLYPMYSLWAVGMPPPGPDFIKAAELRSGMVAPKSISKGIKPADERFSSWLEALYRSALYTKGSQIPVEIPNKFKSAQATFVPGTLWWQEYGGPQPAKVMVVGKHPGFEEVNTGRLFSGPTSQELVRALEELQVPKDESENWYMTNIVRFPHLTPKSSSSTLPVSWVKDCMPLFQQELRLVHPDYLLCLGDEAIKAVLGRTNKLSTTAGKVFELQFPRHEFQDEEPKLHTVKVMTCMHPARVYRQPDLYPQFVGLLRLFVDLTNGKQICQEETDLVKLVIKDEESLWKLVDELIEKDTYEYALDCEWHGKHPGNLDSYLRTIQVAWSAKEAFAVVVRDENDKPFEGDFVRPLKSLLTDQDKLSTSRPTPRLIGHNFRADLPWLHHYGLDLREAFEAPATPEETATKGGFDTMLAVHSWQETHPFGLEACSSQLLGFPRYDLVVEEWKTNYCKSKKMKKSELQGYGPIPDNILTDYGMLDSIVTWRLYNLFNKPGGHLDSDKFGNNCRTPFWISMRASPAFLEMEMNGVTIDVQRTEEMTEAYLQTRDRKLTQLRDALKWPDFNPNSNRHRLEMLHGEKYHAKKDLKLRPEGAVSLYLKPVKSTGKKSKLWEDIEYLERRQPGSISNYTPSSDKEALAILVGREGIDNRAVMLRDISIISYLLRTVLRPPVSQVVTEVETEEIDITDEAGDKIYEKGMLHELQHDGKVRTHFFQTKETGRASSSRPNLQALSKSKEGEYSRILGSSYTAPLRSIIQASPGYVLVEADYTAAEVAAVGWLSGDTNLIDHAYRSTLDETDLNFYDVHSNTAVRAFKLNCAPTKKGLKSIGKIDIRTAAKAVFFGWLYGQGAEASARVARMQGADVTSADTKAMMDSLARTYPRLVAYFDGCKERAVTVYWTSNCFGRYRRLSPSDDYQVIGENERQFMNFGIQSCVGDAMSRALDYLHNYRKTHEVDFRLLLQLHDAVLLECLPEHLPKVYDEVLPTCMCSSVDIWPTNLDGKRKPEITKPYHLGLGRDVYLHWSEHLTEDDCDRLGIEHRFAK